jgi:hypothetical protein
MEGPDLNKKYTYKDYLTWDDGKRWEIIEGKVYPLEFGNDPKNMSPAPDRRHQEINRNLTRIIGNFWWVKPASYLVRPSMSVLSKMIFLRRCFNPTFLFFVTLQNWMTKAPPERRIGSLKLFHLPRNSATKR